MARPSNRERIVDAAIELARRHGVRGITIDGVAGEAGLTKGGVQYHFASKEDLMAALMADIRQRLHRTALGYLSTPMGDATLADRLAAYVRATVGEETGAGELTIFLDGALSDDAMTEWQRFAAEWTSAPGETVAPAQRIALLAADGLWMNDVTGMLAISRADRAATVQGLVDMIRG